MRLTNIACAAALGSVVFAQNNNGGNNNNGGDGGTTLLASVIQKGSEVDGSQQIGAADDGQVKSLTSQNNFINFCLGKTLQNGLQFLTGSCNGVVMGDIPAKTAMISSIITFPQQQNGASVQEGQTFNITVQTTNLVAGAFTNAAATYYSAPQQLQGGKVVGHTHVTVQDLGNSLNPTTAADPTKFAFFKGINDAGNGNGLLSATVTGGLPAGNYRVCTMTSAANHQPVLMPVAQRGTPDDCTKFIVGGKGGTENPAANDGSAGIANLDLNNQAIAAGAGAIDTSTAAAAASSTAAAGGNKGGNGGKGNAAAATTTSAAAAATSSAASGGGGKFGNGQFGGGQGGNKGGNGQGQRGRRQRVRREFIS